MKEKNKAAQYLVSMRWAKTPPKVRKQISVKMHEAKALKRDKLSTGKGLAIVRKPATLKKIK